MMNLGLGFWHATKGGLGLGFWNASNCGVRVRVLDMNQMLG
jgi:hypothetical protein